MRNRIALHAAETRIVRGTARAGLADMVRWWLIERTECRTVRLRIRLEARWERFTGRPYSEADDPLRWARPPAHDAEWAAAAVAGWDVERARLAEQDAASMAGAIRDTGGRFQDQRVVV